jgi:hypothetical protein
MSEKENFNLEKELDRIDKKYKKKSLHSKIIAGSISVATVAAGIYGVSKATSIEKPIYEPIPQTILLNAKQYDELINNIGDFENAKKIVFTEEFVKDLLAKKELGQIYSRNEIKKHDYDTKMGPYVGAGAGGLIVGLVLTPFEFFAASRSRKRSRGYEEQTAKFIDEVSKEIESSQNKLDSAIAGLEEQGIIDKQDN